MPVKTLDDKTRTQERLLREQAQALAEKRGEEAALAANLQHGSVGKPKHSKKTKEAKFLPASQVKNKNWAAVLDAYNKGYGPQHDLEVDKKTGALVFASHEDAMEFFEGQAKLGHEFLASKMVETVADRYYVFSCGNKKLYQGNSLAEIKRQLELDNKNTPEDPKTQAGLEILTNILNEEEKSCPTSRMRERLQGHREQEGQAEPEALGMSR